MRFSNTFLYSYFVGGIQVDFLHISLDLFYSCLFQEHQNMHPAHPLPFTHSTLFSGEDSSFLILIIFKSFMIRFFHFDFVIRLFGFDFVICFSFWWQKDQSGQKNQIIWIKRVGLTVGSNMFWQTIWTHHVSLSIIYVSFMYFN